MLPLDDPRWHELSSAGGPKLPLLAALRKLKESPDSASDEVWLVVDEAVHQWSTYGTTRAVIPYLVSAAERLPPEHPVRYELLTAVGYLVLALGGPGQFMEARDTSTLWGLIHAGFDDSIHTAIPLVAMSLIETWPEEQFTQLVSSLAILKNHLRVSALMMRVNEEVVCPKCSGEFYPLEVWGKI